MMTSRRIATHLLLGSLAVLCAACERSNDELPLITAEVATTVRARSGDVPRPIDRLPGNNPYGLPPSAAANAAAAPTGLPSAAPMPTTAPAAVGAAPTAASLFNVGDRVQVLWHGRWYPASVIREEGSGDVRIHYTGWASSWDENVSLARLRSP